MLTLSVTTLQAGAWGNAMISHPAVIRLYPDRPQFSHILYLDSIHQPTKEQLMPSKHSLVYWTLAVKPQSGTTDNEGILMNEYLSERVPTVGEQVHIHMIILGSYQEATELRDRLAAGADFGQPSREENTDERLQSRSSSTKRAARFR